MGWPALPQEQLRCTMSRARAWGLPGALGAVAGILGADEQKDTEGTRLIKKFCMPRTPTKKDRRTRITPQDDPQDFERLCSYCLQDIAAEDSISELLPPLIPLELTLWQADQRINQRGVSIDTEALHDLKALVRPLASRLEAELPGLTAETVKAATEVAKITAFLAGQGVSMVGLPKGKNTKGKGDSLCSEAVEALLLRELPPEARRVLEIRQALGSASVKKLGAIERMLCRDNRIRDMFQYCGAERTGRWAGRGPQPQNLPASGPSLVLCEKCGYYHSNRADRFCWSCFGTEVKDCEWTSDAVPSILSLATSRSLPVFQAQHPDVLGAIAGCLRGLFCSAPGHDLICADYSAIEAVVLAFMAGEEWRMEVFRTHGKIYEMSASKITGIPFEEFMRYKKETGEHHPMRKKIGKISELSSGYQGGPGAWKAFGADKFLSDQEIQEGVTAWRAASPSVVAFWRGVENAAIQAVRTGVTHAYRSISYQVVGKVLYCNLPSGRRLSYHNPVVIPDTTPWGKECYKLTHMVNLTTGGWQRDNTYGGKLTENIIQAVARDLLANAIIGLEQAGYPVVMHIHDEIVCEVPEGFGSVEEMERIMGIMPPWAHDWPIRAAGGWRGKRYRK